MRWLICFLFFAMFFLELMIFMKVASILGMPISLLLVVLMSYLGVALVRERGISMITIIKKKLACGINPDEEFIKSYLLLFAGCLLILPGFLTNLCALILLLPQAHHLLPVNLLRRLYVCYSNYLCKNSNQ